MLAIAIKLPTSGLQERMKLHSYCLGTQLKPDTLYSARLCLTPTPPAPRMFPALLLLSPQLRWPRPFSELTLRDYSLLDIVII